MFESRVSRAGTLVARRGPALPILQQLWPHFALRAAAARSSFSHAPSPAEYVSPLWAPALSSHLRRRWIKKEKAPEVSGPFPFSSVGDDRLRAYWQMVSRPRNEGLRNRASGRTGSGAVLGLRSPGRKSGWLRYRRLLKTGCG